MEHKSPRPPGPLRPESRTLALPPIAVWRFSVLAGPILVSSARLQLLLSVSQGLRLNGMDGVKHLR